MLNKQVSLIFLGVILAVTAWADNGVEYLTTKGGKIAIQIEDIDMEDIFDGDRLDEIGGILDQHKSGVGQSVKRHMSGVKNQGARPSCTVFAAIALLELFTGEDYSEQCLAKFSSGRDGGFTHQRLNYVRRHGIYLEKDCPYSMNRNRIPNLDRVQPKPFSSRFESRRFRSVGDPIKYIKSRIAVSTAVGASFYVVGRSQWRSGPFIYLPKENTIKKECGRGRCGGHAVVITGYNDVLQLLEFKNSWGSSWGKGGYGYVSYDYFLRFGKSNLISY